MMFEFLFIPITCENFNTFEKFLKKSIPKTKIKKKIEKLRCKTSINLNYVNRFSKLYKMYIGK